MSEQLQDKQLQNEEWIDEWNSLRKFDKYKENAAQELIERELNAELTKVDTLKEAIESGARGIAGGEIEVPTGEGTKESIYLIVLKGYPFKTLQTDITLENTNDLSEYYGATWQTGKTLRKDPSFWMKKMDEVEGLGKETSAVFCASYYDTEVGVPEFMGGQCSYGFDHVRPNTVVDAMEDDGNTFSAEARQDPQFGYIIGKERDVETPPPTLKKIADVGHSTFNMYNEVVVNRYDEAGNPQKPDYILARGKEGLNGLTVRHAAYHKVPLICILPECYKEIKPENAVGDLSDWTGED